LTSITLENPAPGSTGTMTLEHRLPDGEPTSKDVEVVEPPGFVIIGDKLINTHWIESFERALGQRTVVRLTSGRTVEDKRPIDEVADAIDAAIPRHRR
jgi:hypothetical protein